MRRAMRHGKHLGLTEPFLHKLVATLDHEMGDAYPGIRTGRETIEKTILAEENRFEAVLTEGLPRLEAELAKVSGTKSKVLSGEVAFKLYDTFGVPYDFIEDTAATQGVAIDKSGYESAMDGQRDKARAKSAFGATKSTKDFGIQAGGHEAGDAFEGYATTKVTGVPIVAIWMTSGSPRRSSGKARRATSRSRRRRSTSRPVARCPIPVGSQTRLVASR
jgi:alanyl-tRNA synthetase